MQEEKPKRFHTYTKKMMDRIITVALIDMQFPFILALLDREQIAETLGGLIVTEIVGVFLVYCVKSFFETRESERTRMEEMRLNGETERESSESEENL